MSAAKAYKFDPAFTLLELMVVVVILGIMAAVAAPKMKRGLGGSGLKIEARTVAGALRDARRRAMAKGLSHRLNYDLDAGRLWLTVEEDPAGAPGEYFDLVGAFSKSHTVARGLRLAKVVTSRGEAEEGEAFTETSPAGRIERSAVYVVDERSGRTYTVITMEAVGRVKVLEYAFEEDE